MGSELLVSTAVGVFFALAVVAVVAFFIALIVVYVLIIMDMFKFTDFQWQASGQDRVLWVTLVILFGFVATLCYWLIARPAVQRVPPAPLPAPQPLR